MNGGLPERLDPREAARTGVAHAGLLEPEILTRLADLVGGFDGAVRVHVTCRTDEEGRVVVEVRVGARVRTTCQRCLEPMVLELDTAGVLGVIACEADATGLPDHYEPLELPHGQAVPVAQLAEDELLLALPAHPRHNPRDCAGPAVAGAGRAPGPFAALKVLKSGAGRAGSDKE